jgi:hypothetical protein
MWAPDFQNFQGVICQAFEDCHSGTWGQFGSEVMKTTSGIQKVVTKVEMRASKNDFAYWQTQPNAARLAALEEIRRDYHRWRYGAQPRLQRVYSRVNFIDLDNLKKNK